MKSFLGLIHHPFKRGNIATAIFMTLLWGRPAEAAAGIKFQNTIPPLIGAVLIIVIIMGLLFRFQRYKKTAELSRDNQEQKNIGQQPAEELNRHRQTKKKLQRSHNSPLKSKARYTSLFTDHHAVMLLIDPTDGRIKDANPAAADYYGYSCRELRAMNIGDINTLPHREILQVMEQARKRQKKSFHLHHRLKNGEIRDVEVFTAPISIEGHIFLCAIIHDISARIMAQEELQATTERWERTFNAIPDIVTLQDTSMRIVKINRAGCELFGLLPDEIIGRRCHELFAGLGTPCPGCPCKKGLSVPFTPHFQEVYHEYLDKTFRITTAPVPDAAGKVEYVAHTVKDISQNKELEQQLLQTEKMRTVVGLAAGVAHEINTPLSAILQSLELVQMGIDPDNEENRKIARRHDLSLRNLQAYLAEKRLDYFIDGARQSAINSGEIITRLLEFSRPRAGHVEAVDLREVIRTTWRLAQSDYTLKKKEHILDVKFIEEFAPNLGAVPCMRIELEEVLFNLIKNAVQAMADNNDRQPRLILRTGKLERYACIEVEDNGPGMEMEIQQRVFEPFFTTKKVGEGTGLGLAACYSIIHDKHHGKIEVNSTPGKGTTFFLFLPLQANKNIPAEK